MIRAYDIATGRTRTVHSGPAVTPTQSAGGVAWTASPSERPSIHIAAPDVPQAVLDVTTPESRATLATDGTRWAWWDALHTRFGWYDGTTIRFVTLRLPPGFGGQPLQFGVADNDVFFIGLTQLRDQSVLDVRTGAIADLPDHAVFVGGGGAVAVGAVGKTAHVVRLDTQGLPGLTC